MSDDVFKLNRRELVAGGGAALLALLFDRPGQAGPTRPAKAAAGMGFDSVPVSHADTLVVPDDYVAEVVFAWGDPVSDGPAWNPAASAAEQEIQAGMDHDGMHFFPLPAGGDGSDHGLLVVNHEATDDGLLHPGGMVPWTAEKVRKAQAAVGVSVIEIRRAHGRWQVVRPSRYARRLTARTEVAVAGPAAGHPLLRTAADPSGALVLGTLANCAGGVTPWGTWLTCEENFSDYFATPGRPSTPGEMAYGVRQHGTVYRWHEHDRRFDLTGEPNEVHRFGWVVEVDPFDPRSTPRKRTALGRLEHECAAVTTARDGRLVVYMTDDDAFRCLYKFVSRRPWREAVDRSLDDGTLFVAQLGAGGRGRWWPLVHGEPGLTAKDGFPDQASVLVHARLAADRVGGTKMDRPEWIAVHPATGEVYCTLTNNVLRGAPGYPGPDAANPRHPNAHGHIVRWREDGSDAAATAFDWEQFVLAGDPAAADPNLRGTQRGDAFGAPDGLAFDRRGLLWVQTDVSAAASAAEPSRHLGTNGMYVLDPSTRECRRFLTGPRGCEITGITFTPDQTTVFVNVQHPGEIAGGPSDPAAPTAVSSWPDGPRASRPRSATVAIRRRDGGVVGT